MAAHNVLVELQRLAFSRPALDASVVELSGWYERKAEVLEHMAADGVAGADLQAARAHEHAAALLAVA